MDEKQKRLLAMLAEIIARDEEPSSATVREIHKSYDLDLHKALDNWFDSQRSSDGSTLKTGQVMATLAYYMAHTIYRDCETDDEICMITQAYGDYIHQSAHAILHRHGPSSTARKVS